MEKKRGMLVKTKTGKKGIIYNSNETVNGKFKVHCVDDDLKPLTGEDGKQIMVLASNFDIIGYTD